MQPMYYIGLDVHKRKISYCVKDSGGKLHSEGSIPATRFDLDRWMKTLPEPWSAAMEATMFTGWIYDHLNLFARCRNGFPRRPLVVDVRTSHHACTRKYNHGPC